MPRWWKGNVTGTQNEPHSETEKKLVDPTTSPVGQTLHLLLVWVQTAKSRTPRVPPVNEEGGISVRSVPACRKNSWIVA